MLYALERFGCASVTLKDKQTARVKAIYVRKGRISLAVYRFWQVNVL